MADGPANKTAPAEVVAAALNKPTPGFAGMKTKLGGVPVSTALFADGKKNHKEPALRVSAAVFFFGTFCERFGRFCCGSNSKFWC
jgi:hypothetical protein